MDAIFLAGAHLQEVLEARLAKDQIRYQSALQHLPDQYRNSYHVLLTLLVQFDVTFFDGRRGAEGIEKLTQQTWKFHEENGVKYLKKVGLNFFGSLPISPFAKS